MIKKIHNLLVVFLVVPINSYCAGSGLIPNLDIEQHVAVNDISAWANCGYHEKSKVKKQIDVLLAQDRNVIIQKGINETESLIHLFFFLHRNDEALLKKYKRNLLRKIAPDKFDQSDEATQSKATDLFKRINEFYNHCSGYDEKMEKHFKKLTKELADQHQEFSLRDYVQYAYNDVKDQALDLANIYIRMHTGARLQQILSKEFFYRLNKQEIDEAMIENVLQEMTALFDIAQTVEEKQQLMDIIKRNTLLRDFLQEKGVEL